MNTLLDMEIIQTNPKGIENQNWHIINEEPESVIEEKSKIRWLHWWVLPNT
jgi:hypothetical protein